LKILHISTFKNGGAGDAAWRLHAALKSAGVDSNFLTTEKMADPRLGWYTTNNAGKSFSRRLFNHLLIGYRQLNSVLPWSFDRINLLKKWRILSTSLTAEYISAPVSWQRLHKHPLVKSADIIHLHWVANLLDYPSFFDQIKKPVVWTLHDLNPLMGCFHFLLDEGRFQDQTSGFEKKMKTLKRNTFQRFKRPLHFIAPSWYFFETYLSDIVNGREIHQIGYTKSNLPAQSSPFANLRKIYQYNDDDIILLIIATSLENYRKGFDLFLKAMDAVTHPVKILAVGKENLQLAQLENIRFTGFISNSSVLADYYGLADGVVIPSREDNLPNVMLEAFSAGTPVISFATGGMKEHVLDGVTGKLAGAITAGSLADAINTFIDSRYLYHRQIIQDYANTHFSDENIVEAHLKVYKACL